MCGSHCDAWRWWCDGVLLGTLSDLVRIQGTLNWDGYHKHSAAIRHPIWFALSFVFQQYNDPKHSRLCKGYLTKKESGGVLHQITWPPQSPDLNPIEIVWDELEHRVKEKQPTNVHMLELLQDCWKSIPGEAV